LIGLFFFIENIFVKLTQEEIEKFRVIFCIAGLFGIISFPFMPQNSVFIAYERFVALKFFDLLNKVLTVSLMVIALLAGFELYTLVAVNALVGIILIVLKYQYLSNVFPIVINFSYFNNSLLKKLFGFSAWVTVIDIAKRLLINITPMILGILSGSEEIAIFAIGATIEGYTWMFASALGGLFLPEVSRLMAADNNEEVNRLMVKVGRIQLFVVGIIIIGFITLGKQFVTLWVGDGFKRSYFVVLFLIVPGVITFTQEIAYTLLIVENKLKYWAVLFSGASALSTGLSMFLSPRYGAIGSSMGICTALMLCHVIGMNIVFSRVLKLDIGRFFRECHLKLLFPLLFSLGMGFLINVYIPANSLVTFLPKAALLAMLYSILMWLFGLNSDEKQMIKELTQKIHLTQGIK
jgi:O-antigen/teichoic acid export membrane protein